MKKIIIIGGGGNGLVVANNIQDFKNYGIFDYELLGFFYDHKKKIKGYKILGKITLKNVSKYINKKNIFFFWSLFSKKLKKNSLKKLKALRIPKKKFITIIHPTAIISKNVKIGYGCNISSLVNISPSVKIENHVNIFSQCMVGHDTVLKNYAYLANNSVLGAKIKVGEGAYIGMNSTIRENLKIGNWSTVGMGSVVLKNIRNKMIVVGNPATELKK